MVNYFWGENKMVFKNTKYVIYNFLPYEYMHLESYLEKMALKGWILDNMKGIYLKFKRSEPKNLKYSVDIMDSVSFFDGRDSERALEYREYCKKAGWDFVCEREKIQVYCNESNQDRVEIHTDEAEKFNTIRKASLKYVCLNFITLISLLLTQYIATIGGSDAHFLANLLALGNLLFFSVFSLHEIIGIIRFIAFNIKGKRSLNRGERVSYNFAAGVLVKRLIYKILMIIMLLTLIGIMKSDLEILSFIIILLLLIFLSNYIITFIRNKNYKNNKAIITTSYIILSLLIFTISISAINNIIIGNILEQNYNYEDNIIKNEKILTLQDFDDKNTGETLYLNRHKSPIASYVFYSNEGEKVHLSYSLFESKYQWTVKYYLNKKISFTNKRGVDYIEKETNLPKDIKVYMNEHGHEYIIISPNKMIEISTIEGLSEDEFIDIVYKVLFK
jgi:Protein of unknown function (DUF2812)